MQSDQICFHLEVIRATAIIASATHVGIGDREHYTDRVITCLYLCARLKCFPRFNPTTLNQGSISLKGLFFSRCQFDIKNGIPNAVATLMPQHQRASPLMGSRWILHHLGLSTWQLASIQPLRMLQLCRLQQGRRPLQCQQLLGQLLLQLAHVRTK